MKQFLTGAIGYPLIELMWRGRTHWSMSLAGGLAMKLICKADMLHKPRWIKALICSAGITGIEAACGLTWNRKHQVWDYRRMPCNWRGQICLPFSTAWFAMSWCILTVCDWNKK